MIDVIPFYDNTPGIIAPKVPGEKFIIPNKVEFYITNVCNLNCHRCNRFNDHHFKGWQHWSDFESTYEKWAEKINLSAIVILGGEPLLNPTIIDWITGLNRVWKKSVQILSNGTRLNSTPGLYEALNNTPDASGLKNFIGISLHNRNEIDWYLNEVQLFLKGKIVCHSDKTVLSEFGLSLTGGNDYLFRDENGVQIWLNWSDEFVDAAVHPGKNGKLTLHNNDVSLAHGACAFAQFKCYHFIKGKLYKCGPVALFPEFDQQHNLDISDQDRILLNSYQPLDVDEFDARAQQFLSTIDDPIPQCKFCPVNSKSEQIFSIRKGNNV